MREIFAFISTILAEFGDCFKRKPALAWFVTIVMGLMLRSDMLGLTSIVRELFLEPKSYYGLLHFFLADSWKLQALRIRWWQIIKSHAPLCLLDGYLIMVADGVKVSKDGLKMPALGKHHQESESQSKPEYIWGHHWGCVGLLMGQNGNLHCVPASLRIHSGLKDVVNWDGADPRWSESHVVQMVQDCCEVTKSMVQKAIAIMDRYYLTVPALRAYQKARQEDCELELIIKVKKNCVAFDHPPVKESAQRGRPRKRGDAVRLWDLFSSKEAMFKEVELEVYGERKKIKYHCVNLLWGKTVYQAMNFILVVWDDGVKSILACTKKDLDPETVISLYSYRVKIESLFRTFKQTSDGFGYHFWSKYIPRLNHFAKSSEPTPLSQVTDEKKRAKILKKVFAIERFVLTSSIAVGIAQIVAVKFGATIKNNLPWQRTPTNVTPSVANTVRYLRERIWHALANTHENDILQLIRLHQIKFSEDYDYWHDDLWEQTS